MIRLLCASAKCLLALAAIAALALALGWLESIIPREVARWLVIAYVAVVIAIVFRICWETCE